MRVHLVDPSAYTPPYDHALCGALANLHMQVDLFTSRFSYGAWPPPSGYRRHELFYRAALGAPGSSLRTASKLACHVPDMLRYRRAARAADVVHFQWLAIQQLDGALLPSRRREHGKRRPLVLTAHDVLPREPHPGQLAAQRRLYERFDAIVVHSYHGRSRLIELGVPAERVHVIAHGALTHLVHAVGDTGTLPRKKGLPVVLCFGLIRPYKGIDLLLDAWKGAGGAPPIEDAELWIVGMPRMDTSPLRAGAPANVTFLERFVADHELAYCFREADLVALPYRQADQSGVLATALAFGRPLLVSDVGGFPEVAQTGAARVVPAGDAPALGACLRELLGDRAALDAMSTHAERAADGPYSWSAAARSHLKLYEQLLARSG